MSYDVTFKLRSDCFPSFHYKGTDEYIAVGDCNANITSNVKDMLDKLTGISWKPSMVGYCKDVMPLIENGYQKLKENSNAYTQYNAANGWGTTKGVMTFFADILIAWHDLQEDSPAFADIAYFFIE